MCNIILRSAFLTIRKANSENILVSRAAEFLYVSMIENPKWFATLIKIYTPTWNGDSFTPKRHFTRVEYCRELIWLISSKGERRLAEFFVKACALGIPAIPSFYELALLYSKGEMLLSLVNVRVTPWDSDLKDMYRIILNRDFEREPESEFYEGVKLLNKHVSKPKDLCRDELRKFLMSDHFVESDTYMYIEDYCEGFANRILKLASCAGIDTLEIYDFLPSDENTRILLCCDDRIKLLLHPNKIAELLDNIVFLKTIGFFVKTYPDGERALKIATSWFANAGYEKQFRTKMKMYA